ncbi:hypothetical protein F5879DRAFT_935815 [Lentinula edodes]|nr:hypothetical protein F5879DRAFT_935815 [Lentinula edodes]
MCCFSLFLFHVALQALANLASQAKTTPSISLSSQEVLSMLQVSANGAVIPSVLSIVTVNILDFFLCPSNGM